MKKIFLLILTALAFASCTLYMDLYGFHRSLLVLQGRLYSIIRLYFISSRLIE